MGEEYRPPWPRRPLSGPAVKENFLGCLLGGAVGDALGAPIEFETYKTIKLRFGPDGLRDYAPDYGGVGRITDDTQMTLFTAEALLQAWAGASGGNEPEYAQAAARAYLRWLATQGTSPSPALLPAGDYETGRLFREEALHNQRAPGNTCLSALKAMRHLGDLAQNDSKGCGGVMRVAPVGLYFRHFRESQPLTVAFDLGCLMAAVTHGHPTGYLTGGALAVLVLALADGATLPEALAAAKSCLAEKPGHEETLTALELAESLARSGGPHQEAITRLGEGWVAEEALAISVYCALAAESFEHGVLLAVNHDGDSDSTGAITGNLLGVRDGVKAIPAAWLEPLELREVISEIADDLYGLSAGPDDETSRHAIRKKYLGE
jgi:ADP-ribosylglycohydrolase